MRSDKYKNKSSDTEVSITQKPNKLTIVLTIIILAAIVVFIVFTIRSIYDRSTAEEPVQSQTPVIENQMEKYTENDSKTVSPLEKTQIVEEEIDEYAIMQRGNDPEHVEFDTQEPDPYAKAKAIRDETKQQEKEEAFKQDIKDALNGVEKGGESEN